MKPFAKTPAVPFVLLRLLLKLRVSFALLLLSLLCTRAHAQEHSVAREWNEELLEAIRNDFARPVVHARNLYHVSAAMYDCWSLVNRQGSPALMNTAPELAIEQWLIPDYPDTRAAAEEAMSYAAFRLLRHRYRNSPGWFDATNQGLDARMVALGYDRTVLSTDYRNDGPAALGNYVAEAIIAWGLNDGANEAGDYNFLEYPDPVNPPLQFENPFSIFRLFDPNRWQTLQFPGQVIDQSGNPIGDGPLPFLGAEWGRVTSFALSAADRTLPDATQFGNSPIYHDPGPPPFLSSPGTQGTELYRWNFELVLKWSGHLDPDDGVLWDISPGGRGNVTLDELPTDFADYPDFYNADGTITGSDGHPLNPVTGQPYAPNLVPRGDYTRVLAEFWADGPASETPPGHWFSIFNTVMDHPLFERRLGGEGPLLDVLEYDAKAYLALGGAMHDAAISAWSIKGAYDYIRPISAIRWMAKNGQASNPDSARYNVYGLEYDPGYIEPLGDVADLRNTNTLAQVRAWAWIGPEAIDDSATDVAGVGWINPAMWYPYQRPNFVTPNFAGYISGHSTYSSAAATVLEQLTGSPYFPGGLAEFVAKRDSFLVFEKGPSVDVVLQWATYRDASNETSLSRIWGGIHPPVDDIPGRFIGEEVGTDAFDRALGLFAGSVSPTATRELRRLRVFPNPAPQGGSLRVELPDAVRVYDLRVFDALGREALRLSTAGTIVELPTGDLAPGTYFLRSASADFGAQFVVVR